MSPLRVLHVVGAMNPGGVETWLMRLLRRVERARVASDFLPLHEAPGSYDAEIRALGGQVLPCPGYKRPWVYAWHFRRIMRAAGPYDVIHCHLHEYSGLVLALARRAGIRTRIAHSHHNEPPPWAPTNLPRRAYLQLMHRLLDREATVRLAVSRQAAAALFAQHSGAERPWRFMPCGIDLAPFAVTPERAAVRAELGLTPDALVLGHVGRLVPVKNHDLLLRLTLALTTSHPDVRLVLIGDGPLRAELEARAGTLGLHRRVTFLGARPDVAHLLGGLDLFVLPSRTEGLGVAGVEAQAAGVPCVVSDGVAPEMDIVPGLVWRVPRDAPPEVWAATVLEARNAPRVSRAEALEHVLRSPLNLEQGTAELLRLYAAEVGRAGTP